MTLAASNLSITQIKAELGVGSPNTVSGLNLLAATNPWAFYSPKPLQVNGTTKEIEAGADTSPYKMGDFRLYNHAAQTPQVRAAAAEYTFPPGDTTKQIGVIYDNFEANIKRATGSNPARVRIRFWETYSGGVLSNQVGAAWYADSQWQTTLPSGQSVATPPTGHSVTQTEVHKSGSPGALFLPSINTSGVGTTAVTRYADFWFMATGDATEIMKPPNNVCSFLLRQQANPLVNRYTYQSPPSDGSYFISDIDLSNMSTVSNQTTLQFRIKVKSTQNGGYRSGTMTMRYLDGGTYYNVGYESVTFSLASDLVWSTIAGSTTLISFTMPNGRTWSYDSIHNIYFDFNGAWG
jgi:hypothetical protein